MSTYRTLLLALVLATASRAQTLENWVSMTQNGVYELNAWMQINLESVPDPIGHGEDFKTADRVKLALIDLLQRSQDAAQQLGVRAEDPKTVYSVMVLDKHLRGAQAQLNYLGQQTYVGWKHCDALRQSFQNSNFNVFLKLERLLGYMAAIYKCVLPGSPSVSMQNEVHLCRVFSMALDTWAHVNFSTFARNGGPASDSTTANEVKLNLMELLAKCRAAADPQMNESDLIALMKVNKCVGEVKGQLDYLTSQCFVGWKECAQLQQQLSARPFNFAANVKMLEQVAGKLLRDRR